MDILCSLIIILFGKIKIIFKNVKNIEINENILEICIFNIIGTKKKNGEKYRK